MLRHHLLQFRTPDRPNLYSKSVGSLINPIGALKAVTEGKVDVAPVDSYCLDLLRASDHPLTRSTRTIATTPASPIPALVASADMPQSDITKLQSALLRAHEDSALESILGEVLVRRFVKPDISGYDYTETLAKSAVEAGYAIPA
jgi:ABC-type phosphate/phosphonate transport system substrate-binding protein